MKRTIIEKDKAFPLDAETFTAIQESITMTAMLGNIAGDRIIVSGCDTYNYGASRYPGYVFLRTKDFPEGEVLYWEGGVISAGMYVKKQSDNIMVQGYEYNQVYTLRSLVPGLGSENYSWADFTPMRTNAELYQELSNLRKAVELIVPPPLGTVLIWSGLSVPANYRLCDGGYELISQYPALYAAIGTKYNTAPDYLDTKQSAPAGYFRVPDLRGRFIVGFSDRDSDYGNYSYVGGSKQHALTVSQIPSHNHSLFLHNTGKRFTGKGDANELDSGLGTTGNTGGGQPHENRPPYYTLAYIMRLS